MGNGEKIDLPEKDEGAEHDKHGSPAASRPAEGGGKDLIHTAEKVEGGQVTEQQLGEIQHIRVVIEDRRKEGGEDHHDGDHEHRYAGSHKIGNIGSLFCPFFIPHTEILPDEGGRRKGKGLDRQKNELVDLGIGRPAAEAVGLDAVRPHEVIAGMSVYPRDIGLHKYVGKGGDRHLNGGGDPHRDDFPEDPPVDTEGPRQQTDAGGTPEKDDHREDRRNPLGDHRGVGERPPRPCGI